MVSHRLFPFESIRKGQKDFINDVASVLKDKGNIIAHAPTGIGKTAAVLAPILEHSLKEGLNLFFLAPKHTQHMIVVETLRKIKEKHNTPFSMVDFIGKQWMCPQNVGDIDNREFHEFCRTRKRKETCTPYNNVHRRNNAGKVKELVDTILATPLHSEKIQALCNKNELCPYEVCVKAGRLADVIVCDYYHIFPPKIREAFLLKLGKQLKDSVIVVDEAHNLPERIRKILSVTLNPHNVKHASNEASVLGYHDLAAEVKMIGRLLKDLGRTLKEGQECFVLRHEFTDLILSDTGRSATDIADELVQVGEEILTIPNRNRSYAKSVSNFLKNWVGEDFGYARILKKEKHLSLSYKCLDPSFGTKPVFDNTWANILMSGTLTPLGMYASLLGLEGKRTILKAYSSPFPAENRLTLIVSGVTTKYSERSEFMYKKYGRILSEMISKVPGNAAVFYPAYHLMDEIISVTDERKTGKQFMVERKEMTKEDRRKLYLKVAKGGGEGRVIMGVQAGSFSEGVDYPEGMLSAVFVVGLPLEKPNLETQALIDYYDVQFARGWDFGYIYPAMNRSLQAAGRCIRSEDDRGAIVLLDERFRWANYSKCFPPDHDYIVTETPTKYLEKFFENT
ncbi:MAG: ATP-dependent DNA helicase [Methanobacteriota archaeon]